MLQESRERISFSRSFRSPVSAKMRICVSRLSIPKYPGGQHVSGDLQLPFQSPDQGCAFGACRQHPSDGFSVTGDKDTLRAQIAEDRQALLFELGRIYLLHTSILYMDRFIVHV